MVSIESDLNRLLDGMPDFTPYCEASPKGDALTFYFKPDADYSKRLTEHVTLMLSLDSDEVVGCRIKGITGILEDMPNYIKIKHKDVRLSLVFWAYRGSISDEEARKAMNRLAEQAGDMLIPTG